MSDLKIAILACVASLAAPAARAAAPSGQYSTPGTGTILDNKTGLVWQQQTSAAQYSETNAQNYCAQLNTSGLGGFTSGWQLPSISQLESLVDHRIAPPGPTIDSTAFPSAQAGAYWSNTIYRGATGNAWFVDFSKGTSDYQATSGSAWVRCLHVPPST